MSIEANRKALAGYLTEHDERHLAEDAVFTDMSSGQRSQGRQEIAAMLDWFYHVAFDAVGETTNLMVDEEHAVWEGTVVGKHVGDFAGVPATGKEIRVPICVTYDLADEKIRAARIYLAVPAFLEQVGATG
jgi:steroid delta-isomerase-like uncharacterized protein